MPTFHIIFADAATTGPQRKGLSRETIHTIPLTDWRRDVSVAGTIKTSVAGSI